MAEPIDLNSIKYMPVGRCIYCGSSGGVEGLRTEHTLPYSLGGNIELPESSCHDCEKITSYIEGVVSRSTFGPMRAFFNIQKRTRKQVHTIQVEFSTAAGPEIRTIPVKDSAPFCVLEQFDPPGILVGASPSPIASKDAWLWYSNEASDYLKRLIRPGDIGVSLVLRGNGPALARVVAKIAHASATAQFGFGSFRPLLPDIILGRNKNIGHLVGMTVPAREPDTLPAGTSTQSVLHLSMGMVSHEQTGHTLLVADVQLFPFIGSPIYTAVVGEPSADLKAHLIQT